MKTCPNCNDANSCGDYEGPTCEVCGGTGLVKDESSVLQNDLGEIRALLGLKGAPQPQSPHEAFRECIDATAALVLARADMLRVLDRARVFMSAICGHDGEYADEQEIIAEMRAVIARANGADAQ